MLSNAKIMRRAERALKRTKCYREHRPVRKALGYDYELDYVLVQSGTALAYAHCADDIITFDPLKNIPETQSVSDWAFSLDSDLFSYLERGYELAGMSPGAHYEAWCEISKCCENGINYLRGMQRYLCYCKQNRVTADYLRKKFQYDGMDVMTLCG